MAVAAWWGEHLASSVISMADYQTVSKQFYLVSIAAQSTYPGGAMGATVNTTAGAGGLKVMVNAPKAGDPAFLWDIGETKVIAGAAITAGSLVMSDSSGRVITFVDDGANVPIGEARMAASNAGDVITCFVWPNFARPMALTASGAVSAAGNNRATATQLTALMNDVTTVAASTGVVLPAAKAGLEVVVVNAGANTLAIYGGGTDTIDGTAGSTGTTLTTAHRIATFYCFADGAWISSLGGAVSS